MKKKIDWVILDGNGKPLWPNSEGCRTREGARHHIRELNDDIFEEWNQDVVFPLSILRREWRLVEEKKAR